MSAQRLPQRASHRRGPRSVSSLAVLAANVRALLEALDWNIPRLNERTGYSVPFLTGIVRETQNPSIDAVCLIAAAFGVEARTLLDPGFTPPSPALLVSQMLQRSTQDILALRIQAKECGSPCRKYLAAGLRRAMTAGGVTASHLFEQTGVAVSTIAHARKGQQNMTLTTLDLLADALDIASMDLLQPHRT